MTIVGEITTLGIENKKDERTITPEKYTEVTKYRMTKVLESVSGRKHACGFQRLSFRITQNQATHVS